MPQTIWARIHFYTFGLLVSFKASGLQHCSWKQLFFYFLSFFLRLQWDTDWLILHMIHFFIHSSIHPWFLHMCMKDKCSWQNVRTHLKYSCQPYLTFAVQASSNCCNMLCTPGSMWIQSALRAVHILDRPTHFNHENSWQVTETLTCIYFIFTSYNLLPQVTITVARTFHILFYI